MEILKIKDHRELSERAALWFHEKWHIPLSAYEESIAQCIENTSPVPQWYVVTDGDKIIAGLGVIENDFHSRRDLTPNVCAVYVEEAYRSRGIAGEMLRFACNDMSKMGIDTLYLLTDHTSFYERYGWEFYCTVQDSSGEPSRMYIHKTDSDFSRLEGEHIVLRKAQLKDLEPIYRNVWSDKELLKYMFYQPTESLDEAADRMGRTIEFQNGHYAYFIALKDSDEAIGFAGLKEIDDGVYSESGICIASKFQGLGYGKEVMSLLLSLAFKDLYASEFEYAHCIENDRSRALCHHFGFKYTETCKEKRKWDNKELSIAYYRLTRTQYFALS